MIFDYMVMRTDGTVEHCAVEWQDANLERLRELIEPIVGGDIEHVAVLATYNGAAKATPHDMFVNERGAIMDPPLPINEEASRIYQRATLERHPHLKPDDIGYIHGNAVLFRDIVWW